MSGHETSCEIGSELSRSLRLLVDRMVNEENEKSHTRRKKQEADI